MHTQYPLSEQKVNDSTIFVLFSLIFADMALPLREQRHPFIRYEGLQYTDSDIADFESRLTRIHKREVHRVWVFDFGGLPDLMAGGLSTRMLMEHRDDQGTIGFGAYWAGSARQIPDKGDPRDYWTGISSAGDFLGTAPSYTAIWDLILRLCHRGMDVGSVNVPYLLDRYLRLFVAGRKSGDHISGGQFVARLAEHFGLLTAKILGGLTVIAPELSIIDMGELVRLQICIEVDDTWAWVAMGPERQPDVAAGAPAVAEDAPTVDEVDQDVLAPM
ncbi:hypothetical protein Tco_1295361 [Tanacetum coccineum]